MKHETLHSLVCPLKMLTLHRGWGWQGEYPLVYSYLDKWLTPVGPLYYLAARCTTPQFFPVHS